MKTIRLIAAILILAVIVIGIGQKVAAAPPAPIDVPGDPKTGAGPYKLGGCITGTVKDLKPGFKINVAVLEAWNSYRTDGLPPMPMYYWSLPGGTVDIFSCVTIVKIMQSDKMLKEFPLYENDQYSKDFPYIKGSAEVCLDTPSQKKQGYIYFYDQFKLFYNKDIHGDQYPNWVKVGGPFAGGTKACVPVTYSGVYGYYAPDPDKDLGPDKVTTTTYTQRVGTNDVPFTVRTLKMNGAMAVGGCVTGNIENLVEDKGYTVKMELLSSLDKKDVLPELVGKFYECVVDLKFYQNDKLINELPKEDGDVTLCYAIPPFQQGTMYYYDKYFDDKAVWKPISDPYKTGIACGPVMKSGYYGMVDVQVKK